jgi:hypothetical protein
MWLKALFLAQNAQVFIPERDRTHSKEQSSTVSHKGLLKHGRGNSSIYPAPSLSKEVGKQNLLLAIS